MDTRSESDAGPATLLLTTTGTRHDSKLFFASRASPLRSRFAADFHIADFRTPCQDLSIPSSHLETWKKPGAAIPVRVRRSIVPVYRIFLYGVDCIIVSERRSLSVVRAYCNRRYGITVLLLKFRLPPLFGVRYYVTIVKGNSTFTILARESSISPIIQVAVPPRATDTSGVRAVEAAVSRPLKPLEPPMSKRLSHTALKRISSNTFWSYCLLGNLL